MSHDDPENLHLKKRHFLFVINNPEPDDYTAVSDMFNTGIIRYIIYAQEHFNIKDKTPHLQGYLQFKECSRTGLWIKNFLARAHIEWCKGSHAQNRNYCLGLTKGKEPADPNDVTEFGTFKPDCQGQKFAAVKRKLDQGVTMGELAQDHFGLYCRYHKSFKRYKKDTIPRRRWKTEVIVLFGTPETGKSRTFWDKYPDGNAMEYVNSFWSDYCGEEQVLWDDFNPNDIPREQFLKLTDRYPMKIRQIGGWSEWSPKVLYISTNYDPQYWYGVSDKAVQRRITQVITYPLKSEIAPEV